MTKRLAGAFLSSVALVTIIPSSAFASEWVLVTSTPPPVSKTYVDKDSIKRTASTIRYWSRSDHESHKAGWKKSLSLVEADCADGRYRNLQITVYYVDGTNASTSTPSTWTYPVPETVGQSEMDYVCSIAR